MNSALNIFELFTIFCKEKKKKETKTYMFFDRINEEHNTQSHKRE